MAFVRWTVPGPPDMLVRVAKIPIFLKNEKARYEKCGIRRTPEPTAHRFHFDRTCSIPEGLMLQSLFERGFAPHGFCLQWQPGLIWLHAVSDLATGVAYFAIPVALAWIVLRRRDLAFGWIFWLFALFILACGTTHFMDVWVLWESDYGVQGLLKAFTAFVSILTAILLWRIMPTLQAIPTPGQLRRVVDQLSEETVRHEHTVEQLRRTEESFQLLVESVRDCAMFMVDTTGHVTSWNAGAQHVKHYRADEIIGRHFSCFYTAEDQAAGKPMQALQIAASEGYYQAEGSRVRRDGSLFMADVLINPILDRDGALVGFAKVTRDITQRKAAEAELEQARAALAQSQKMEAVGQLTGGIAHDFNNMLTAILGSLELLETRREIFTPATNRMLAVIRHASERGAKLTGRLLAFSRKQALQPAVTDINRLVSDMSELLRRSLGESISIEIILGEGLWPTLVDQNQLESALLNLAVNARDAMHRPGRLTIETGHAFFDGTQMPRDNEAMVGEHVFIAVSDTGSGMAPEVLAHAFEPFFTTKDVGHGTGLGLSQVYGFVKQSGGNVELHSEVGRGTTVKLYFPRTDVRPEPALHEATAAGTPLPLGTATILVVEDDEDVRGYIVNAVRHLGYKVLEADGGMTALALLDERPDIQLLFTDVGLPGMNGRDLADAARSARADLKVVFTSAYARTAVVNLGLSERGVHLLHKPFRIGHLARILRTALDADQ
jgi:PAS domain S-box-containing protein